MNAYEQLKVLPARSSVVISVEDNHDKLADKDDRRWLSLGTKTAYDWCTSIPYMYGVLQVTELKMVQEPFLAYVLILQWDNSI